MPFPLISVIIPTYNRANFLHEAIESINDQNYSNLEIIIVDDGSTDNTKKIVKNLGSNLKYIYQKNKGPAAARNTGLKVAKGEIIGFLDSDDLWPVNKLNYQLKELLNSDMEIIIGGVKHLMLKDSKNPKFVEHSVTYNRRSLGSALFKISAFKKVGFLDENLILWEDLDWFLRAHEFGIKILWQKKITLLIRVHRENMSRDVNRGNKFLSKVLRNSIKRKRFLKNNGVKNLNLLYELSD